MKMEHFVGLLEVPFIAIFYLLLSIANFILPRRLRLKKDIRGQKVLITGAGSGLGRQLAIEFSKHETCLLLLDINRQSLLETETLLDLRSKAYSYFCDVSDYRQVYETAEQVRRDAGDVDILVNNAGVVAGKYLVDCPEEKIVKSMEVNALAHFWTCKAFLPAMMEKDEGHLVSIASIVGKSAMPKATDYCASKFAAIGFAESIELELRERGLYGIKVTIVCPAHMDTRLFQGFKTNLTPVLSPEDVAKEIVLGVLEEKELIIIPTFFRCLLLLMQLFPRKVSIYFFKVTGNMKVMEHFMGRQPDKNENTLKSS